jgi:hypothetical protein
MRCHTREAARRKLVHIQQALEGGDQFGSGGGFAYKSVGTKQADGCLGLWRTILHTEKQDFGLWSDLAYLESRRDAIHHRHTYIQKHQFRVERFDLIDSLLAVFRFTTDGKGVCN